MGYCPYICIYCRCIHDNGWHADETCFSPEEAAEFTGDDIKVFEGYEEEGLSLDVCCKKKCLRKHPRDLEQCHCYCHRFSGYNSDCGCDSNTNSDKEKDEDMEDDDECLTITVRNKPIVIPLWYRTKLRARVRAQAAGLEALFAGREADMLQAFDTLDALLKPGVQARDTWNDETLRQCFRDTLECPYYATCVLFVKHFEFLRTRLPWNHMSLCYLAREALDKNYDSLYATLILSNSALRREFLHVRRTSPWLPWYDQRTCLSKKPDRTLMVVNLLRQIQIKFPTTCIPWNKIRKVLNLDDQHHYARLLCWRQLPDSFAFHEQRPFQIKDFTSMLGVSSEWWCPHSSQLAWVPSTSEVTELLRAFCDYAEAQLAPTLQTPDVEPSHSIGAILLEAYLAMTDFTLDYNILCFLMARWPGAMPPNPIDLIAWDRTLKFLVPHKGSETAMLELLLIHSQDLTTEHWQRIVEVNVFNDILLLLKLLQRLLPHFLSGRLDKTRVPYTTMLLLDPYGLRFHWDDAMFQEAMILLAALRVPEFAQALATFAAKHNQPAAFDSVVTTAAALDLGPMHVPRDLFRMIQREFRSVTVADACLGDTWAARAPAATTEPWFTAFPSMYGGSGSCWMLPPEERTAAKTLRDYIVKALRNLWGCQTWPDQVLIDALKEAQKEGWVLGDVFRVFGKDDVLRVWSKPEGTESLLPWYFDYRKILFQARRTTGSRDMMTDRAGNLVPSGAFSPEWMDILEALPDTLIQYLKELVT